MVPEPYEKRVALFPVKPAPKDDTMLARFGQRDVGDYVGLEIPRIVGVQQVVIILVGPYNEVGAHFY